MHNLCHSGGHLCGQFIYRSFSGNKPPRVCHRKWYSLINDLLNFSLCQRIVGRHYSSKSRIAIKARILELHTGGVYTITYVCSNCFSSAVTCAPWPKGVTRP